MLVKLVVVSVTGMLVVIDVAVVVVTLVVVDVLVVMVPVVLGTERKLEAKSPLSPVMVTTYSPGVALEDTVNEPATIPPETEHVAGENMLGVMVQEVS